MSGPLQPGADSPVLSSGEQTPVWRSPVVLAGLLVLAVLALYWQTVLSMEAIWSRSETFTHGYLIAPISLFLIWQRRKILAAIAPTPDPWGLPVLVLIGVVWLLAHYASVMVIEQLAMVAMIAATVWTVLGRRMFWAMLFPLAFLFFAVPVGEELIPPLMDFTANFTVAALQLSGIPVYREGLFFEIPSGRWSVVEGCSGVRYLIASVTLGCLYAYLTYRSPLRRTVFVLLSIIVPIIANGLRAYMIVMIAHLSDMKLALGVDHFIYGWVFFGLVMLLLFWAGSFWREDHLEPTGPSAAGANTVAASGRRSTLAVAGAVFLLLAVWPALGYVSAARDVAVTNIHLAIPSPAAGWQAGDPLTEWRPRYSGTDASVQQSYAREGKQAMVYLAYYRHQRQGAELINSQNVLVKQKDPVWRQVADGPREIAVNGKRIQVREGKLRSGQQDLLVWHWYWMDGVYTTNHYLAKFWEAKAKLFGETGDAAAIIVVAEIGEQGPDAAAAVLNEFVVGMEPAMRASLENVAND